MDKIANILRLTRKELSSLRRDVVLMILIGWAFSVSIYMAAAGFSAELHNASIAIVDMDRSQLSRRIQDALLPPQFQKPVEITYSEIDRGLDTRRFSFVLVIPEDFEKDVLRGLKPDVQVDIDGTSTMQAGIGATYLSNIVTGELDRLLAEKGASRDSPPLTLVLRYAFNPNLTSAWFSSVMEIINNVTMLTVILTGAAFIREREHGTLEHLMVMPLTPLEIMLSKVLANGLVIVAGVAFCLWIVVERLLAVPIAGSIPLFLLGVAVYLFFGAALGILLATIARSMPQFGLLFFMVVLPMILLSGGSTPLEGQPAALRAIMQFVPSTQFVAFAQAILYRGAGFAIVWHHFLAVAGVGLLLFVLAALRFRKSITAGS